MKRRLSFHGPRILVSKRRRSALIETNGKSKFSAASVH
jgi:hypothetical protein